MNTSAKGAKEKILAALESVSYGLTSKQIAEATGLGLSTINPRMSEFIRDGKAERVIPGVFRKKVIVNDYGRPEEVETQEAPQEAWGSVATPISFTGEELSEPDFSGPILIDPKESVMMDVPWPVVSRVQKEAPKEELPSQTESKDKYIASLEKKVELYEDFVNALNDAGACDLNSPFLNAMLRRLQQKRDRL